MMSHKNLHFLIKLNIELPYDSAIPLLHVCSKEFKARIQVILVHQCSQQHYSEQSKGRNNPTVHQQMNGIFCLPLTNGNNGILFRLKKEVLMHATTWMNPEKIMLRQISQTQKDKYCMIPHIRGTQNRKIHRDRK